MSLVSEKETIKKEIDKVRDKNVLQAIKTLLDYSNDDSSIWEDNEFIEELERRGDEFRKGKVKTYSLEEVESAARKSRKKR